LIHLEVYFNQISSLDVSQNVDLVQLQCGNNPLSELNVDTNTNLVTLTAREIGMSEINLLNNPMLEYLLFEQNQLTSIDLSNNAQLQFLYINNNQLQTLDLSQNPNLTSLSVSSNELNEVNLKNGSLLENYNGIFFDNPNLQFVCGDDFEIDQIQTSLNSSGLTDTVVNSDCNLNVADNYFLLTDIYPNPSLNELYIHTKTPIHHLELYDVNGKMVKKLTVNSRSYVMNMMELPSGFYVLKLTSDGSVITKSILKK
jgi:Leucine-rich repeat (LRR) protein